MSEPLVRVRDEGPVRWLTLNRPTKRNALSAELVRALKAELEDCGSARCLALTGAGDVFCAGADLSALQSMRHATYKQNLEDSMLLADLFLSIAQHPLPVVAAMNGAALGGGAGLAVACDLACAVQGAEIGFPEVRVGFVPAIVMNFLIRTVGASSARRLCLTGRPLDAQAAEALGLLQVVEDLDAAVAELGRRFAQTGPAAVAATKRLLLKLHHRPLSEGLRLGAEENAKARATDECQEGIAAFLEKRRPRWSEES